MKHPYLILTLIVLAVYGQIIFFDLTYLDDYTLIVANSEILGNPQNLIKGFGEDFLRVVSGGYYYRPLITFSFMLNALIAGTNPFVYHLTNVLLHLVTVLFLYKFLNEFSSKLTALLGAIFFAVHPALLQTIAWIPGRTDILPALFTLVSIWAFQKAWYGKSLAYIFLHFTFMALALLSKELGIFIPILCASYAFLIIKKWNWNRLAIFVSGWAGLIVLWFFARSDFISQSGGGFFEMLGSGLTGLYAGMIYYGKILLPFNLSTFPVLSDSTLVYGLVALVLLGTAMVVRQNKNYHEIIFGTFWFVLFLFPALVRPNPGADPELLEHRLYLPMIGIIIVLLQLAIPRLVAYSAIILLAILNIAHARNFADGFKYWSKAAQSSPHSAVAHRQLGVMLYLRGDKAAAQYEYEKAIELDFQQPVVHTNLGLVYQEHGKLKQAENEFLSEIKINPEYDQGYFNLGNLYYELGRFDLARLNWEKTLKINPGHQDARRNLHVLTGIPR
ncbi:MAG: hypothetical protein A2751_04700 [Candidatus Doudnabacteria bacterium RIFCSPHIGHO2_01_FULL_46_14]|uniref:Glycosyltransferase RgtA/B/C/D-like domain-containing protein n=1 Tax=Candidatus Doudnabacteria bacterium RIFCSPHIGHO2_01_FULL_46_14 TaxID=1817824 RepID=A0A1F5NNJ7_9BACT|nr:MAG: hypothetical protein A2751_04700 [Candidatus Doudnabacteria bacterium RIFCSPHIGHO2_01_FULL_46_14]